MSERDIHLFLFCKVHQAQTHSPPRVQLRADSLTREKYGPQALPGACTLSSSASSPAVCSTSHSVNTDCESSFCRWAKEREWSLRQSSVQTQDTHLPFALCFAFSCSRLVPSRPSRLAFSFLAPYCNLLFIKTTNDLLLHLPFSRVPRNLTAFSTWATASTQMIRQ